MKCGDFDPRDLALGELAGARREEAERHVEQCEACLARVEEVRLMVSALRLSPDREIPRRIAFVSDPVFELSWWRRFWRSGPQLGFASAALLAAAIVTHGFMRPAAPAAEVALDKRVAEEVARRLPEAVEAAVDRAVDARVKTLMAGIEQRVEAIDKTRLAALERRVESREDLKNIESAFNLIERRLAVIQSSAARYGGDD